jgi:hypothetical protein
VNKERGIVMLLRRSIATVVFAGLLTWLAATPAVADGVYQSRHYAFESVGGDSLRSGFVENIHPNGPNVYAHERYVVNGADPNVAYEVVLMIYPMDPTCSSAPIVISAATIHTNTSGNGSSSHVFTPSDAEGLRGLTVGGVWTLIADGSPRYWTACETVILD